MRAFAMLTRVSVVALLAGLLQVVGAAPASAAVPFGDVNFLSSPEAGKVHVRGWAIDGDQPGSFVTIHVYVGGHGVDIGPANAYRPDVGAAYPAAGDFHGFDKVIDVPVVGDVDWLVYGIDTQGGPPALLETGRVTVADATPTGAVDSISSSVHRTVDLAGWASDPNAPTAPVDIHVYIGGNYNTPGAEFHAFTTSGLRSNGRPGFSKRLTTAKTGAQPYYVYAINVPGTPGNHALIRQGQVTIYVDTTAPDTTITYAPPTATTNDVIHVTFSADEPNSTFECRWDLEPWFACQSGTQVRLTAGKHQASVRAKDAYGNQDATPAVVLVAVTQAPTTQPPPPPPAEQDTRTIAARAVKKKSRLRIDVGPDSASSSYRVVIQRKAGKRWRKVERVRTRGTRDVVVVNLRRGTYRVVLPTSTAGPAITSNTVRLKR